jgi:trans-2,3-dihydro-3-hydroxyanthranilate isomerase
MNGKRSLHYRVVDVFSRIPLQGNPLAVFSDATGIDDVLMQQIAKELNLSETVFVAPSMRSDCVAGIRIFTPKKEIPFAGHPTLGAGFILLDEGRIPKHVQDFAIDLAIGRVPLRIETGPHPMFWLRTPEIGEGRRFDRALCAKALGLGPDDLLDMEPQLLSAGNPMVFIALRDRDSVDRAVLDSHGSTLIKGGSQESLCFFVFTPTPTGAYSRMFAPDYGILEDPATGSAMGPLALYMIKHGLVSDFSGQGFTSEQGVKMGRRSHLHVKGLESGGKQGFEVGGNVVPLAECVMRI